MVSPNVNRILQAAQALNDAEREELRRLLDGRASRGAGHTKEQQLEQRLLRDGIIGRVPPDPTSADIESFIAWKPIAVQGGPVSQTIIEDRR